MERQRFCLKWLQQSVQLRLRFLFSPSVELHFIYLYHRRCFSNRSYLTQTVLVCFARICYSLHKSSYDLSRCHSSLCIPQSPEDNRRFSSQNSLLKELQITVILKIELIFYFLTNIKKTQPYLHWCCPWILLQVNVLSSVDWILHLCWKIYDMLFDTAVLGKKTSIFRTSHNFSQTRKNPSVPYMSPFTFKIELEVALNFQSSDHCLNLVYLESSCRIWVRGQMILKSFLR